MPPLARTLDELRSLALAYPESHEDFPWGHSAIKVKTKAFVFLYLDPEGTQLTLSAKLPHSSEVALVLPFAKPTGYGLARSGWVTAAFGPRDPVPLDILRDWIDESFRAIAPAKISKTLGPTPPTPRSPAPPLPTMPPPAAKPSAKKSTARASTTKPIAAKPSSRTSASAKPSAKKSTPSASATKPIAAKSSSRTSANAKPSAKTSTLAKPAPRRTSSR